jgi:hypothetical protein
VLFSPLSMALVAAAADTGTVHAPLSGEKWGLWCT